ncbi:hypothetical protein BC332_20702 [Capsicum chinense]|nr:hypothetical protein BC332_20702 [Capsicum chinense]
MNFGKSVLVPSVQELAKQHLTNIQARYGILMSCKSFTLLANNGASSRFNFFMICILIQVISHGVTPSLLEDFKREVIELFRLSMEEKKKLWQQEDNFEGFGQAGVLSEEQKLDWNDMFTIMTLPPYTRKVDLFQKLPSKLSYVAELLAALPGATGAAGTGTAGPCLAFGTTYWSKYVGGCLSLLLRRSVAPWSCRNIIEAYFKEINSLAMIILCQLEKGSKDGRKGNERSIR